MGADVVAVRSLTSSAWITTFGSISLEAFPDIASNILFSLAFMLVCRIVKISDCFISSASSPPNLPVTSCSSISVFILSIFCGSALMNNLSFN